MTSPQNFDDTTPAMNRPIQAPLEPETIVSPYAHVPRRWVIGIDWQHTIFPDLPSPAEPLDVMFDVDDVLIDTIDRIHAIAFERGLHDGSIEPAWDGVGQYGCEPEAYWDLWSHFAATNGYVDTPPIAEAVEALRKLYFAGHRIHLVTARGFMNHASEIREWTKEWAEIFAIPWHTLTFAQDKVAAQIAVFEALELPGREVSVEGGVTNGVSWSQVLSPKFDYAIDDRVRTIEALRGVGVEAYVLTHAHNRAEETTAPRVGSVTEFIDIILEASA